VVLAHVQNKPRQGGLDHSRRLSAISIPLLPDPLVKGLESRTEHLVDVSQSIVLLGAKILMTMGHLLMTVPVLQDHELSVEAARIFDEIRSTRPDGYIGNSWRALAHDQSLLRRTWETYREVMAPGELDPLTKELIYIAVSVANGCNYCIQSHATVARNKGLTLKGFMELVAVVGMASESNRMTTALQTPLDDRYKSTTATSPPSLIRVPNRHSRWRHCRTSGQPPCASGVQASAAGVVATSL